MARVADETDLDDGAVDEAEQLVAQLLEAGYTADNPQGGDETGDEGGTGDDTGDEGGDTGGGAGDEGGEGADEGTQTGEQPDPAAAAPVTPPPAPAPQPGPFDSLTEPEKQALLKVRSLLTDNPDLAEGFDNLVKAKFQPEPDRTLPPEIDPEDTESVLLWNQIQELKAQRDGDVARQEADRREVGQTRVNREIASAVDRFKVAHPTLSDEDIASIRTYTAANVNIPNVMGNFPDDPVEGIVRSMEIGSMTDPATRDKVLGVDAKAKADAAEKSRKQKLSALSGSTGSGPRTNGKTKKPQNWNEVSQRLTKELEELGGV